MIRQSKIMDRDNDFCIFALGEYLVCGQEGESVGTDIFHGSRIFRIGIFELNSTGIIQIHTRVFASIVDPGSGSNGNLESMFTTFGSRRNGGFVPTVQDITCGDLQHTGSRPVNRQLLLTGYQQSLRNLLDQFPKIVVILLIN